MCGAPKPPPPVAPPAPLPQTDAIMQGRTDRQRAAARSAGSGYQATMLTEGGGDTSAAGAKSPVLGG